MSASAGRFVPRVGWGSATHERLLVGRVCEISPRCEV